MRRRKRVFPSGRSMLGLVAALLLGSAGGLSADEHEARSSSPGTLEFVGKNLIATANGRFHSWRIIEKQVDPAAPDSSYVVVEVDLASVDTDSARRDDHLRTADFFEVDVYPTATVRGHSLRPIEGAAGASSSEIADSSSASTTRYAISFDIDLHGVKKTVEGEVELVGESPARVEGSLILDRMDFGVGSKPSRWNPMSIGAEIPVRFRIELEELTDGGS